MPTHTPSPHRFLAPKAPSSHSKPAPSGLRNVLTAKTPKQKEPAQKVELHFKKLTPARQFVLGPGKHARKKSGDDVDRQDGGGGDMRVQATPRVKPKRTFERVESIEGSQSSPVATQGDEDGEGVVQSVELDHDETEDEDEMLFEPTAQHKRRRVSLESSPPLLTPQTPVAPHAGPSHCFKLPAPPTPAPFTTTTTTATTPLASASTATATTTTTPAPHRPAFILPALPTSPPKPSKPLPEIFSPSRKTGKYLPNGLAATATGWIIDMAGTSYAAQHGVLWGREREDGVKMRIRVRSVSRGRGRRGGGGGEEGEEEVQTEVECYTGGVVFVRGSTEPGLYNASRAPSVVVDDDAELRILLAGQGGVKGVGGVKVKVGSVVGIRQPLWDIAVAGESWVVGVDWVVLS